MRELTNSEIDHAKTPAIMLLGLSYCRQFRPARIQYARCAKGELLLRGGSTQRPRICRALATRAGV